MTLITTAKGARLERMVHLTETPILYPATEVNGKLRGGSHVCFPQFGPDVCGKLPQHGFGRDREWEVLAHGDERMTFGLKCDGEYEGVNATIDYDIVKTNCQMRLQVKNNSDKPVRVAPGFHPYFATHGKSVRLNGEEVDTTILGEMRTIEGNEHVLEVEEYIITLTSAELSVWAVWSDNPSEYICVEPTLAGNAFLQEQGVEEEYIEPGEMREYTCDITWKKRADEELQ